MSKPTVFLHVGGPKTGTTFLQHTLWHNRHALRHGGVLYPGSVPQVQFWAAYDLLNRRSSLPGNPRIEGSWSRLVSLVRRSRQPVVVLSHESLAGASRAQVERAVADLSFARVHVVYTARDTARQLPAAWQERVKSGSTLTYAEFLRGARTTEGPSEVAAAFRRIHDASNVLGRWARSLPADHAHVVTVPPPGSSPTLLWERFCDLLGVQGARFPLATEVPNSSLGAVEAATLRGIMAQMRELAVPLPAFVPTVKHVLSPALAERRGAAIGLPEDAHEWATEFSAGIVERVRAAGYDVVGDLSELVPGPSRPGADPDAVGPAEQAETAMRSMALLLKALAERHSRPEILDRRPPQPLAETKRWLADRARRSDLLTRAYRRVRSSGEAGAQPLAGRQSSATAGAGGRADTDPSTPIAPPARRSPRRSR